MSCSKHHLGRREKSTSEMMLTARAAIMPHQKLPAAPQQSPWERLKSIDRSRLSRND
jgi:hypothetical protein